MRVVVRRPGRSCHQPFGRNASSNAWSLADRSIEALACTALARKNFPKNSGEKTSFMMSSDNTRTTALAADHARRDRAMARLLAISLFVIDSPSGWWQIHYNTINTFCKLIHLTTSYSSDMPVRHLWEKIPCVGSLPWSSLSDLRTSYRSRASRSYILHVSRALLDQMGESYFHSESSSWQHRSELSDLLDQSWVRSSHYWTRYTWYRDHGDTQWMKCPIPIP